MNELQESREYCDIMKGFQNDKSQFSGLVNILLKNKVSR